MSHCHAREDRRSESKPIMVSLKGYCLGAFICKLIQNAGKVPHCTWMKLLQTQVSNSCIQSVHRDLNLRHIGRSYLTSLHPRPKCESPEFIDQYTGADQRCNNFIGA